MNSIIDKLESLNGHISRVNIITLRKYIRILAKQRKRVLAIDIGTCAGKSAITMASVAKNVEVMTIDPVWNEKFFQQVEEMKLGKRISYFQQTSEEFEKDFDRQIDACFIDGEHGYVPVKHSIEHLVTKMRQGGYAMFHDYNIYDNWIGKAVDEFEGKIYEFVEETSYLCKVPKEGSIYVGKKL